MSKMSSEQQQKPKRRWTKKQLRASQGLLTQQAKTNIYANQSGMTCPGAVRHGADIRSDDIDPASNSQLSQIAETNIYDSQKGMKGYGAVRHGADIRVKELYEEGDDDEYPTDEEEEVKPAPRRSPRPTAPIENEDQ